MKDRAKGLNVSIASVYYHFKNKEHILFNIIESAGNDFLIAVRKAQEASDDPLEQLQGMLISLVLLTKEKRNRVKVYVEEQHNLSKRLLNVIYKQHREIYDCYAEQSRRVHRAYGNSVESVSVTTFAIFGMMNWSYRWYKEEGKLTIQEVAKRLANMLFYGILSKDKRLASPRKGIGQGYRKGCRRFQLHGLHLFQEQG